jgi:putative polyhydroxyalkanoate system protein
VAGDYISSAVREQSQAPLVPNKIVQDALEFAGMRIQREHELGKDEARRRVSGIAEELCDKYGLNAAWDGDELKINGSGIHGRIAVAGQSVDVAIKLGFALSMMSSVIRTSIEDALDKHLT